NLADGVDGLLHVSQITQERIEKPSDVLTLGQEVTAKITQLDLDAKRISLSIRAMLPKPERKPRNTRAPREEENTENADGTLNIAKYIAKLDREEAKKEAAEKAKALKDSIEEKAFEAGVAIEEKVTEEKAKVAEAVADIKEAAEEKVEAIKEAAVEKAEEVQEAVAEKVEEIKEAIEEKKDEA
ncbi:MAG: S1 RNA-binding domain-containing protein, partial [Lachnospiraceae bacterium]|nr:S1 RNA-binding domain-containing protein [Lachnospiraceae bacterium]